MRLFAKGLPKSWSISVIIARVLFQLDNIQVSSGINPKDIKPAIPQNKLPAIAVFLFSDSSQALSG